MADAADLKSAAGDTWRVGSTPTSRTLSISGHHWSAGSYSGTTDGQGILLT